MATSTLKELAEDYIVHGDFILSSFQESKWFIDLRTALLDRRFIRRVVDEVHERNLLEGVTAIGAMTWSLSSWILADHLSKTDRQTLPVTIIEYPHAIPMPTSLEQANLRGYRPTDRDNVLVPYDVSVTGSAIAAAARVLSATRCRVSGFAVVNRTRDGGPPTALTEASIPLVYLINWDDFGKAESLVIDGPTIKSQAQRLRDTYHPTPSLVGDAPSRV